MISREQASRCVVDRSSYYDALVRKGWLLPAKKQAICTKDFLEKVRNKEVWCPHRDQGVVTPKVVTPPPKQDLANMI